MATIRGYRKDDTCKPVSFHLLHVPTRQVKHFAGVFWQQFSRRAYEGMLKHADVTDDATSPKRFVHLPRSSVLRFDIPSSLGGWRKHRRLMAQLQWLSINSTPRFVMEDMAQQRQTRGYDFEHARYEFERSIAEATRHLGWTVRSLITSSAAPSSDLSPSWCHHSK